LYEIVGKCTPNSWTGCSFSSSLLSAKVCCPGVTIHNQKKKKKIDTLLISKEKSIEIIVF